MTSTSTATVSPAMAPTGSRSGAAVDAWLLQAFIAARAPTPCQLPAPQRVSESEAPRRPGATPTAVRGSFVLMLALSASMLLLGA